MLKLHFIDKKDDKMLSVFQEKYLTKVSHIYKHTQKSDCQ